MPAMIFNWFNVEPKMLMMLIVVQYNFDTTVFFYEAGPLNDMKNMSKSDATTNYCLLFNSTSRFFLFFFQHVNVNDKHQTRTC